MLACRLIVAWVLLGSPGPKQPLPVVGGGAAAAIAPVAPADSAVSPPARSPEAVPSGLDLLYDDRIAFAASGEPLVTVGIVSGEKRVSLRAKVPVELDFWEAGIEKHATVRVGDCIEIGVRRSTPASRQYYVDLEGSRFGDKVKLERALASWRGRGYQGVGVLEEGIVLGLHGRVLDNRDYRLVIDSKSNEEATRLASAVFSRFGAHAEVKARLTERPWGELTVRAGQAPLGVATSYVRLIARGGPLQVDKVEFAPGYAWHGREDRSYRGELYVVVDPSGALAVVNVLGIEQLLEGTVPAELYASSPVEALKAQAVAARNHLLAKLGRRHHDEPFRICSEQHCQVYAGTSREDPRSTAAVRATAGLALFLADHLVECAYSASCGGHTEDNDAVWGDDANPALRGRPDFDVDEHPELAAFAGVLTSELMPRWIAQAAPKTYCARGAAGRPERVRWSRTLTAAELARLLTPQYASIGALRDLIVDERGPGGRVVVLRLVGALGSAIVVHELAIRRLFGNLNSGAFVLELARDKAGSLSSVTFRGAGWGHGVGMCQLGAIGRAEAGQSFEHILAHYYNGATVERLY
jgi:stage II sporulation protein D